MVSGSGLTGRLGLNDGADPPLRSFSIQEEKFVSTIFFQCHPREAAIFFSGKSTKAYSPPPLGLVVKRTATNFFFFKSVLMKKNNKKKQGAVNLYNKQKTKKKKEKKRNKQSKCGDY